jgi:iron complex outermembrane receptor protein
MISRLVFVSGFVAAFVLSRVVFADEPSAPSDIPTAPTASEAPTVPAPAQEPQAPTESAPEQEPQVPTVPALKQEPQAPAVATPQTTSPSLDEAPAQAPTTFKAPPLTTHDSSYETVVVGKNAASRSATFTDTPWIELPQSTETVTAKELRDWGITTANDSWKLTSGFFPQDQDLGSRGGGLAKPRGVSGGWTLLNGFAMPQRMSLYYDTVSLTAVDFLRGSADALDGAQTPTLTTGGFGGEVNLVSRDPSVLPAYSAGLIGRGFGNDRLRLTLNANQPIVAEKVLMRLDVAGQLGRQFYVPGSYPLEHTYAIAPAIRWHAAKLLSLTLRGSWQHNKGYAYKGVPVLRGKLLGDYDGYLGNKDSTFNFSAGVVQLQADSIISKYLSAHAGVSYMNQKHDYSLWAWGTSKTFSFDNMYDTETGLPSYSTTDTKNTAYATRAYIVGMATTNIVKHEGLIGGDAEWTKGSTVASPWTVPSDPVSIDKPVLPTPSQGTGLATTGPSAGGVMETKTIRYGALVQYQAKVGTYARALVGGRLEHHESKTGSVRYKKDEPSFRSGLTLLPLPFLAVYGNYTQGATPNWGLKDADGKDITLSQRYRQFETGIKADVLERLRLSATGFITILDKVPMPLAAQPGTTTLSYELSGKITYKGIELGAQGRIMPWWDIRATYTNIKVVSEMTGHQHNLAPYSVAATTSVRLPRALQNLRLGASYRYVDERQVGYSGTIDPRNTLPSYNVVGLLAEYALTTQTLGAKNWLIRLNIDNIFNKKYYAMARQVSETTPGEPSAVMLTLLADF